MNKTKNITGTTSEIVILLIFYASILIFTGVIKSNILIDILPTELANSAKISSYVSIITASIISVIVIGLIIGLLIFSNIVFELNVNEKALISSFDYTIIVLIFMELFKFIIAYFTLETAVQNISFSENFLEEIKLTNWYILETNIKNIMICISTLTYSITLRNRYNEIKLPILILVSIVLLFGFYTSSIDFFDQL